MNTKAGSWKFELSRKLRHLYLLWPLDLFFTEAELRKIHRNFFYSIDTKPFNLIKSASPNNSTSETGRLLTNVRSTCKVFQHIVHEPYRFRVSLPNDECIFNRVVALGFMYLNGRTVLHAVDLDTNPSAARFTSG